MNTTPNSDRELRSWKEIAAYFGKSVRTVQDWERKLGLPVRRLNVGGRDEVVAASGALDAWKLQREKKASGEGDIDSPLPPKPSLRNVGSPPSDPETPEPPPRRAFRLSRKSVSVLFLVGFLTLGSILAYRAWPQRAPSFIEFEGKNLVAKDVQGREVWRHEFPFFLEKAYYGARRDSPKWWVGDLDGDGKVETLFAHRFPQEANLNTSLYCFSQEGRLKWRFVPGRVVRDAVREYSPIYLISGFVITTGPGGELRVVVISPNVYGFPNQVAVLDKNGQLVGEYWHTGHLLFIAKADLDGDGSEEVLLAGVNDGQHRATLMVFDPRKVSGASVQAAGDETQLQGFSPGSQKAEVLFPQSDISKGLQKFNRVSDLAVTDKTITAVVVESVTTDPPSPYIIYELSYQLEVRSLMPSSRLENQHRELERLGLLDHSFSSKELEPLKKAVVVSRSNEVAGAGAFR
jgi:hypothetical protein